MNRKQNDHDMVITAEFTTRFKIVSLEPILAHDVVEDVWKIQVVLEARK